MANNPYVNKVIKGNTTVIDLTADTVATSNLQEGATAHDMSGAVITGTAQISSAYYDGAITLDETYDDGGTSRKYKLITLKNQIIAWENDPINIEFRLYGGLQTYATIWKLDVSDCTTGTWIEVPVGDGFKVRMNPTVVDMPSGDYVTITQIGIVNMGGASKWYGWEVETYANKIAAALPTDELPGIVGGTTVDLDDDNVTRLTGEAFAWRGVLQTVKLAKVYDNDWTDPAFYQCSALTKIDLRGITELYGRDNIASGCVNLQKLDLRGVTRLNSSRYLNCTNNSTNANGLSINFAGVTQIDTRNGFTPAITANKGTGINLCNCTTLQGRHQSYPALVTPALTAINLESLQYLAYLSDLSNSRRLASLTSLYLPAILELQSYALSGLVGLTALVLPGSTVAKLYASGNVNSSDGCLVCGNQCYIYVPSSLVDTYKARSNWATVASYIRAIEDYPAEVAAAKDASDALKTGWDA